MYDGFISSRDTLRQSLHLNNPKDTSIITKCEHFFDLITDSTSNIWLSWINASYVINWCISKQNSNT